MRRSLFVRGGVVGVAAAMVLAACSGGGSSAPEPSASSPSDGGDDPAVVAEGLDAVCAEAEAEDTMEAWLNFGNPDGIVAAFREAYPDVDVDVLTILPEDAVPRIVTETSSGTQPTADVFYGGLPSLVPLVSRDLVDTEIDWTVVDVAPELIGNFGTVRVAAVAYGVGYNPDKYSPEDLPDSWDGFLDPQWDGKLILDPRGRPFSFLSISWGQEKTVDFVRELLTVNPIVLQGTTAGLLAVASGEGDILLNSKTAETAEQQAVGAPVEIKLMDEVPVEGTQLGVLKGTEQPLAAQCFVGWAASEDGSAAIFEADFKANELPEAPEGAVYIESETEEDLEVSDATIEEMSLLITGGGS